MKSVQTAGRFSNSDKLFQENFKINFLTNKVKVAKVIELQLSCIHNELSEEIKPEIFDLILMEVFKEPKLFPGISITNRILLWQEELFNFAILSMFVLTSTV